MRSTDFDILVEFTGRLAEVACSRNKLLLHGEGVQLSLLHLAVGQAAVAGRPVSMLARDADDTVAMWVSADGTIREVDTYT